jgi:transcriptional regulator with XRE-family HTH domain
MKVNEQKSLTASIRDANSRLSWALGRRRIVLSAILATIKPGASLTERARIIGVSRQTLYNWLQGTGQPNMAKARKLAKLTGVPAEEFREGA